MVRVWQLAVEGLSHGQSPLRRQRPPRSTHFPLTLVSATWLGRSALLSFRAKNEPCAPAYSDEKVANREIRVWHGATETGP